jgi:hypothetical protein
LQEIHGAAQQSGGAIIGIGRAAGDQGRIRAGLRQSNRGRQSGWAASDHNDVVGTRYFVHLATIDVPCGIFKPMSECEFSNVLRGGTPQSRMCKSRRFLIALRAKWTR